MLNRISATELDNWSRNNPRQAQEILPELVIRLVLATSDKEYNMQVMMEFLSLKKNPTFFRKENRFGNVELMKI